MAELEVKRTLIKGKPQVISKKKKNADGSDAVVKETMPNIVGYIIGKVGDKTGKPVTKDQAAMICAQYGLANATVGARNTKEGSPSFYIQSSLPGKSFKSADMLVRIDDEEGNIIPQFQELFKATKKTKTGTGKAKADPEAMKKKVLEGLKDKVDISGIKF